MDFSNFMGDVMEKILSGYLVEQGKASLKALGRAMTKLQLPIKPNKGNLVFIPEAAVITTLDSSQRELHVRLILLGSASWTRNKEVSMEPDFTATIFPPGSDAYHFGKGDQFLTTKLPKGMHAYYLGKKMLHREHALLEMFRSKVGVIFGGNIEVKGIGKVPIFPLNILAGGVAAGGGFLNQPIELRAIKSGK
jgi:hypothetical protein